MTAAVNQYDEEVRNFWGTRSGRWRVKLESTTGSDPIEKLTEIISSEILSGRLPAGAILPGRYAIAREVGLAEESVDSVYETLHRRELVERDSTNRYRVANLEDTPIAIGATTQLALEEALIDAARAIRALDISPEEATARFKVEIERWEDER